MGQRHQIYVVSRNKDKKTNEIKYTGIGAFHHQWCFGMKACEAITRAADLISINKMQKTGFKENSPVEWSSYSCNDSREINTVITACYGVSLDNQSLSMVHIEDNLICEDTGQILPSFGDNNDGCSLIIIDNVNEEIRAGFFTPGHIEGEHWQGSKNEIYTREQYLQFYYSIEHMKSEKGFVDHYRTHFSLFECVGLNPIEQKELDKILEQDKKQN